MLASGLGDAEEKADGVEICEVVATSDALNDVVPVNDSKDDKDCDADACDDKLARLDSLAAIV
jgi:hypothetical protein